MSDHRGEHSGKINKMTDMLHNIYKSMLSTTDVFGRLWRLILYHYQVQPEEWDKLLDNFMRRMNIHTHDPKKRSSQKTNWTKVLANTDVPLTWKNFLRGLAILNFDKIEFIIRTTKNNRSMEFTVNVDDKTLNEQTHDPLDSDHDTDI